MRTSQIIAALLLLLVDRPVAAQLPIAAGRQISMSNPAWKIFIPSNYYPRANAADILVHFHGDPQTFWNNARYANLNAVIVTVNYSGLSSAYSTPFSNATSPSLFQSLLDEARTRVRQEPDISDRLLWDKLAVSSFSAGYGAVREILKSATYRNDIDALLAADSLYASTAADGTAVDSQMVDYKTFATLAKNGSKTFLFSHSQVPTFTYESTAETGDELMQHLAISATSTSANGLGTLNFYRTAQAGNFRLWGATGADGDSHLEHLQYIGEFLEDLPLAKAPISGDYNADGKVDSADYVVWRKTLGSATDLRANGADTGASAAVIDMADLTVWKNNFGNQASGTGGGSQAAVPEPTPRALSMCLAAHLAFLIRRHSRVGWL
jgi:hypothetical protein